MKKGGAESAGKPTDSFSYNVFQASFWRRFWLLARPFWARPLRGPNGSFADGSGVAWALLALLIVLIFGTTGLLVKLNFQQGEFFTALSKKEEARFWAAVGLYFAIILVAIPVLASKEYVLGKLGLMWRAWMTEHLIRLYFCHRQAFFRLSAQTHTEQIGSLPQDERGLLQTIDNPDQRIVADVESFTKAALNFSVVFLGAALIRKSTLNSESYIGDVLGHRLLRMCARACAWHPSARSCTTFRGRSPSFLFSTRWP
jgi:putative ATP-binding cassette transporter